MTRILLLGDTHGNLEAVDVAMREARQRHCDEVIQLGDFGFGWEHQFVPAVSELSQRHNMPLLWIDGNHENFDALEQIGAFGSDAPDEIAPGVTYLPRGTVLERAGRHILCIGGAYSVDKYFRTNHVSWWAQEQITDEDVNRCLSGQRADIVLSHDAPDAAFDAGLALAMGGQPRMSHLKAKRAEAFPEAAPNRERLQRILNWHAPRQWFHGHYHSSYEAKLGRTKVVGLAAEQQKGSTYVLQLSDPE